MANYRVGRVAQEILKEVNDILRHTVRDPRTKGITITDVDLTGDLQQATIYYSTLNDKEDLKKETQTGLDSSTGVIRKELGGRLSTYHTPELIFKRDESIEYGNHIEQLLNQLKEDEY